jgi:hypothetical protein
VRSRGIARDFRAAAIAVIPALLAVQAVQAASLPSPDVVATTSNPYASCTVGSGGSGTTNYLNAEVEPQIAVNPANNSNVIGVVQQDRWNDGGETWGHVTEIDQQPNTLFDDKETVTADPSIAGTAYVVWDQSPDCCSFPEPSYFSKTTDFGATWSTPKRITTKSTQHGDIGNEIVVDSHTGTLYDFFYRFYLGNHPGKYMVIRSHDGGATWSAPTAIADDQGVLINDPHPGGQAIRTAAQAIGQAAIDPNTGRLYFVWEDARFSGGLHNGAVIASSADGRTWSRPRLVSTKTGQSAFLPTVAVNSDGQVAVTYYDFRYFNSSDPTLPTGVWMKISGPGGRSFSPDIVLQVKPFDMLTAPYAEGFFVGDYDGLAAAGKSFMALYCTTTGQPSNPTDCTVKSVKPIGS